MNLVFFNNLFDKSKKEENKILNSDANKYESSESGFEKNKELGIIDNIITKRKVSVASKNQMLDEEEFLVKEYANNKDVLFYVAGNSSKKTGFVVIYKIENNEEDIITLDKNELPENYFINCVLKFEDDKYVVDENASIEIIEKINQMVDNILEKQDEELKQYRKEDHLYRVEEDVDTRIYLWDMTDKPDFTIEEVDFPEDLLELAKEGAIFRYKNGTYTKV